MTKFKNYLNESDPTITKSILNKVEEYADRLFKNVGIDVEFTKHFLDRANDKRNKKQITFEELIRLFKRSYRKYGKTIPVLGPDAEAVLNDMKTDINMPFVLKWNGKELELVAKTIMRKKNFKTSDPKLSFEGTQMNFKDYLIESNRLQDIKKNIDNWKKDLKRMTKIYRSFSWERIDYYDSDEEKKSKNKSNTKELKKFSEARKLFSIFDRNFDKWIYKNLLHKEENEGYYYEQVRTKAWTALMSLTSLFPDDYDSTIDKHVPAPWRLSTKERNNNIQKYNRNFKIAWEAIETFVNSDEFQSEQKFPKKEQMKIEGVTFILDNWGRKDDDDKRINIFIRNIALAIKKIKKAGFGKILNGLVITGDFVDSGGVSGTYNESTDKLEIKLRSLFGGMEPGVLIHEIGHRFYYRTISKRVRDYWDSTIYNKSTIIKKEDIEYFVKTYHDKMIELKDDKDFDRFEIKTWLLKDIEKSKVSLELKSKLKKMVEELPLIRVETDEFLRRVMDRMQHMRIQLETISDYANTSAVEAYAEAFRIYVDKGPNALGPWTKDFFKRIARYGYVNIFENAKDK